MLVRRRRRRARLHTRVQPNGSVLRRVVRTCAPRMVYVRIKITAIWKAGVEANPVIMLTLAVVGAAVRFLVDYCLVLRFDVIILHALGLVGPLAVLYSVRDI